MNVLAPALIFSALASKDFVIVEQWPLILGSIGVVLGSGLLSWPFAKLLHEDPRTFVPPMMFNNCGNMGLPLAMLAFGPPGFSAMVAAFTISNLQFTLGAWIIDHHALRPAEEPDGGSTFAAAFALAHPPLPEFAAVTFRMVGDALIPMMLLSLGVRLTSIRWGDARLGVIGGLVCPLTGIAMASLLTPLLGLDRTQSGLLLLFGCLPPAVLNFMVAEQFRQEPGKVASIVMIGNMLALLFVPLALVLALR
jgi:predicted permease